MRSAREHAEIIVQIMAGYARRGSNLGLAARAGSRHFREWTHYPANDVVDTLHHTEFYYHAHAANERAADEHGHFHVFSRPGNGEHFHHVVAISLNALGRPTRLFLTDQWVTDETGLPEQEIAALIDHFTCQVSGRLAPVSRWISSMVGLYAPEICQLHQQSRAEQHARLQSRNHHVVADCAIDLEHTIAKVLFR